MKQDADNKNHKPFLSSKRILACFLPIGLAVLILLYALACLSIGSGVRSISEEATQLYPGDKITALVAYMNSEDHSLQKRNRAVWALGQLGHKRALPALEKFYTGQACDHDKYLCQRELKKAVRLCRGSLNIGAWTWRKFIS